MERRASPPVTGGHSVGLLGKFGPQVQIVRVTPVIDAPAAIVVGLNRHWGPTDPLVNAGKPVHARFTAELNVPPPGAAANV